MREALYPHCRDHSFRRRWTFDALPIFNRTVFLVSGGDEENVCNTELSLRFPGRGREAPGGASRREEAATVAVGGKALAVSQNI